MITENQLEQQCINWFKEFGLDYSCVYDITPDSNHPWRKDYKKINQI